jgi:ribosomal protein S27AE
MKPRKFTCLNCGCEFVADTTEYWTVECNGSVLFWKSDCPECGDRTSKSEPWEEKDD